MFWIQGDHGFLLPVVTFSVAESVVVPPEKNKTRVIEWASRIVNRVRTN